MQTKIKSSESNIESESGVVVEAAVHIAGQDPFESFEWIEMDVRLEP